MCLPVPSAPVLRHTDDMASGIYFLGAVFLPYCPHTARTVSSQPPLNLQAPAQCPPHRRCLVNLEFICTVGKDLNRCFIKLVIRNYPHERMNGSHTPSRVLLLLISNLSHGPQKLHLTAYKVKYSSLAKEKLKKKNQGHSSREPLGGCLRAGTRYTAHCKVPAQRRAQDVFNPRRAGQVSGSTSKRKAEESAHNMEYTMMGKGL